MPTALVIDDQPNMRALISAILSRKGFEVITAEDGRRVEQTLNDIQLDLVVTDIFMPNADGIEVIRALRRHNRSLPVIAVSGAEYTAEADFLRMAKMMGASGTLRKPFQPKELTDVVDRLLNLPGLGLPPKLNGA